MGSSEVEIQEQAERLVEIEDELRQLEPSSGAETSDSTRTALYGTATVSDVERKNNRLYFNLCLPDGTTVTESIRWPDNNDSSEPLARLLDACGLTFHDFADITGCDVPVTHKHNRGYKMDIPPSKGIGNKLLYYRRRIGYKRKHYRTDHQGLRIPTLRMCIEEGLASLVITGVLLSLIAGLTVLPDVVGFIPFLILLSLVILTGFWSGILLLGASVIVFFRAIIGIIEFLFPQERTR